MRQSFFQIRVRGVSLLELLLVLIIMAAIILAGYSRYQLYQRNKDLAVIKQNVNLLFQASQTYYHLCCSAEQGVNKDRPQCSPCGTNKFCISTDALAHAKLMPPLNNTNISSPDNYQVSAQYAGETATTNKPIYQLIVSTDLNVEPNAVPWYAQMLQATTTTLNTLIWQKFPSYTLPDIGDNLWILNTELRQFKESTTTPNGDDSCAY